MCQSVVLQVAVVQDVPLHTVVGGEITQVDQGRSPDIGPAASPQSQDSGLLENFPDNQFYFNIAALVSQSVSRFLLSPRSIPTTLNSGRFAKKSSSSLHLDLSLYEVCGRGHQLPNACKVIL